MGETFAQEFLERNGYRIVDVNVRFGKLSGLPGELDIVAWDGQTLCFVEVKTRRGGRDVAPGEAVTLAKQKQIARLAMVYANRCGLLADDCDVPFRFDVVAVIEFAGGTPSNEVRRAHLWRGAFLAPEDYDDFSRD